MKGPTVGVIGIGAFGSRVALRLLWTKYPTLQLYDVDDIATRMFTSNYGGLSIGSPRMLAQTSDIVLTVLPSAAVLREVLFGWEGLGKGPTKGGLVVDLGMTDPLETMAIAGELAEHGIELVDAPAFGTPDEAKDGKLTIVVGGKDEAVERARPVLETLAGTVLRAGATGSAQAASAIADYRRAVELLAASEAIRLGASVGFEAGSLLDISDQLARGGLREVLGREVVSRRFESGLRLGIVRRNVDLAGRLAEALHLQTPLLDAARDAWRRAEKRLGAGADHTEIIRWLESLPSTAPAAEGAGEASPATERVGGTV